MTEGAQGVARVVADLVKGKRGLGPALAGEVAGAIARTFGVKLDEVAILRLTETGDRLTFVVPEKLAQVGSIPLSSATALSVRTVREARGVFINNFSGAKHHTVFEAVPLREEPSEPIQKIMSVPILAGGKAAGVIQVSRKGRTPAESGADFTPKNLALLSEIASALSSCLELK